MNWSRRETSKLISCLHRQPVLYCVNHPMHRKIDERVRAYWKICRAMTPFKPGLNFTEVRQKLRTLRTQYNKEKSLMCKYIEEGQAEAYVPRLWCFEELQILDLQDPPKFQSEELEDEFCSDEETASQSIEISSVRSKNFKILEKEEKVKPILVNSSYEILEYKTSDACTTPQAQLGKIVEWELLQVSDDIFNDTKSKIMRLLENASRCSYENS